MNMSLTAGIVGLPNVGKSTLFNAITKKNILAANYPFATIDPNVGVVTVPDKRLDFLNNLYVPESLVPTAYEFTDIAGLVKGASSGEGLGNKFLSHIREVDAIVEVVRCFENKNIIHVENSVDPVRDIDIINIELILADLEVIDNRINRIGKKASMSKDKDTQLEVAFLEKAKEALLQNLPLRRIGLEEEELKIAKPFNFLTLKPMIYMANISEEDLLSDGNEYVDMVRGYASSENASVVTVCAKIESELSELTDEDKTEFLKDLGIKESGLDKLIYATYDLLGLATYFTAGTDECRAWTFKKGMKAPECAGIIHSDFERGFIRAEIMGYDDLEKSGSEKAVREAGKMRLEGKEYEMQDGDICHFRFNV
jgi:GTP-binding protein YchF